MARILLCIIKLQKRTRLTDFMDKPDMQNNLHSENITESFHWDLER